NADKWRSRHTKGLAMRALDLSFETVALGLDSLLPGIQRAGRSRWELPVRSGYRGYLYIKDAWLTLDACLGRVETAHDLWNYLIKEDPVGNLRFALSKEHPSIHLRADLPLDEQSELAVRVARLVTGFDQALANFGQHSDLGRVAELPAWHDVDLGRLCLESG